jgi:sulfoxide reductase catalytic subunit YedY
MKSYKVSKHNLYGLLFISLSLTMFASCRLTMDLGYTPNNNGVGIPPAASSEADGGDSSDIDNIDGSVTSTEDLHTTGNPPEVDIETYRLEVEGLVDSPLSLTYEDILAYPTVTEVVLLVCPGAFNDNAEWTGVPVWRLLEEAGIKSEVTEVVFRAIEAPSSTPYSAGSESYSSTIPIGEVAANDSIFLAYTVNGEILPLEHGYPLRLVAKDRYGYDWVKWVERVVVK